MDDKCYRITSHGSVEVPALQCHQEEADGCLLFHATHAAREGYQAVVICSEDTDVFIMSLAFHDKIGASLFQKCGTKARRRVVDITKVAATVGSPSQELSVDEAMIKYKGHIRGKVHMPNKPIRRVSKCGVVAVLAVIISAHFKLTL